MSVSDETLWTRRLESLEQRLAKLERFGNVITSTQTLTTFTDAGQVGTKLGKVSSTGRIALEIWGTTASTNVVQLRAGKLASHPGYGVEVRSSTGGYVKLENFVSPQAAQSTAVINVNTTAYSTASGGPAVTCNIGQSKRALVTLTGLLQSLAANQAGFMSFSVTGASTRAATDVTAIALASGGSDAEGVQMGGTFLVSGFASTGSHTFTARYRVFTLGTTMQFARRTIVVQPY